MIIQDVTEELARAKDKFPGWPEDPLHAVAVLNEEVGELNKAILQRIYEPDKASLADVREEAVQTAAMALKFLGSLDDGHYSFTPGVQS